MKKVVCIIALGILGLNLNAQKVIEKNIDYNEQYIDIEVKFAADIKIMTWDKSSIYIKAETTMKEKKYEDLFEVEVTSNGQKISIGDNSESIFKIIWDDHEKEYGKKQRYFTVGDEYEIEYTLYIPKNAKFKVSSINGNLNSEIIEGEFTADLINGNINIEKYKGSLDLTSINGEIDLKMMNTTITAETIHGHIYADSKLEFTAEDRIVGQKVEGKIEDGENTLILNTINGNMYLRVLNKT